MTIKEQLLTDRGFSKQDIEENFANYKGEWNISTLTLEDVKEKQTKEELLPLFAMDSVETKHFCATYIGEDFNRFAQNIVPFTVAPSELDPYIARLCKAINEIGVRTCMSCDGWHRRNGKYSQMELYMSDRYSVLWFWLITEYVFGEYWDKKNPHYYNWENKWEPFNYDPEMYLYGSYTPRDMMICKYRTDDRIKAKRVLSKSIRYASFLEKHKDEFLDIRRIIIDSLIERMEKGEIGNIDSISFLQVRRYMAEVFLRYSNELKTAFKNENKASLH